MLITNTIRYGTDDFAFNKSGLIVTNTPLDCTALTQVDGITATGSQPSDTDRRVAFQVDGTWCKLSGSGAVTLSALATQTLTADSVLSEGNTITELGAATSISGFVGKSVGVAIALYAPGDATEFPTLALEVVGKSNQTLLTKTEYSPEYTLSAEDVEVIDLSANKTIVGSATATVEVALKTSGTWGSWTTLSSAKRQKASAIKFKSTLTVNSAGGSDSAKVNSVTVLYRGNNAVVSGAFADIITQTEEFGENMRFTRVTVKHDPLVDATIKAYATMRNAPSKMAKTILGTGDGTRKTYSLGVVDFDPASLRVYWGATPCYDYDYNTGTGSVSCTAPDGVTVLAECSYGWEAEDWQEMTNSDKLIHDSGMISTGFTYALPLTDPGKGLSAVKVVLEKVAGTVTDAALGTANGKTQVFVLPHAAKVDTISVESIVGVTLVPNSWSYDPASKILSVSSTDLATMTISYDWVSETPVMHALVAAWSD